MECYDTCADRGMRCILPREKISCYECGKIKPCYNIHSARCNVCPSRDPCGSINRKDKDKWRSNDICKCKQPCWQWVLSFLGLGGKLPECCKNVRLTPWESGEVAREALVSKVQDVVNLVSGRDATVTEAPNVKIQEKVEAKDTDKKVTSSGASSEKECPLQETSEESPEQTSGKEPVPPGSDKKKRKSRSSSLPRGRSKKRKSGASKSRSSSRSDKQRVKKSSSKTRSRSSSSTSVSQGDRKRKRRRSKSGSSTKIFNPFKGRPQSSPCNMRSPYCPPLPCMPCPEPQPKSFLSCLNEDHMTTFPQKFSSPSHQQPIRCQPTQQPQIRRSNSMSLKPNEAGVKQELSPCKYHTAVSPTVPLRSHSFDSTPMKFTSPHSSCLSSRTICPRSGTWTCCSCSMKSNTNLKPYVRGFDSSRMSPTCRQSVVRPLPGMCPPSCRNPCCLPPLSQYTSPPSSIGNVSCRAALNILKARQNDALCNQLLSRYGYSPPCSRICPLTCYGCTTANSCCTASCLKYGRFPGIGGCMACRPMADPTVCCVHCENYTNSRTPRSPECHTMNNQLIEFNQSPCERKPLCEFQLPPHCIRETGPRSPVDEYMAIIRVPKPAKKQELQEEIVVEKTKEVEAASKKEQAEEAKPPKKKTKRFSRKGAARSSQSHNVNENARLVYSSNTSNELQVYVAKQLSPCDTPIVVVSNDVSDYCLLNCEESFNNNYGGETYRVSRYSSAGPVHIDFSELNAGTNRYSNMPTHSSASSGFVPRYSRPNYPPPSSDVRAVPSFVSQMYNRHKRDSLDSLRFGDSWYRARTISSAGISAHKRPDNRPMTFNRSTNSTVLENSDAVNSSRYNIRLETAIENKIRELRDLKVFRSPPARKKMYSNSLFEQMAKAHEKSDIPVKRNVPREEFIRETLDQLKHRAEKRKHEFKYTDTFIDLALPNDMMYRQPASPDSTRKSRIENSKQVCTVLHNQNSAASSRDTAPVIQVTKTKNDIHQRRMSTPKINNEMTCDFTKDNSQVQKPVSLETVKIAEIKPSTKSDYEPVFQNLFEQFEENVQVYARSKKELDQTSGSPIKRTETPQKIFNVFIEESQDIARNVNAQVVEWPEENQSSNKVDKSLGNARTMVAESSPPHKPIMVNSSDAENSSVCTCSSRSNSAGTSSVSLEISRFARSARSSHSLSESASCVDTSITFTKVTETLGPIEETSVDHSSHGEKQSISVSTGASNKFYQTQQRGDSRVSNKTQYSRASNKTQHSRASNKTQHSRASNKTPHSRASNKTPHSRASNKTPHTQIKIPTENLNTLSPEKHVLASWGNSGSSVDPVVTMYATKFASIIGNSSVDGSTEYYFIKDTPTAQLEVIDKQEAGDAAKVPSSTDVDILPSQKLPVLVKSITELMREFIRINGTPV